MQKKIVYFCIIFLVACASQPPLHLIDNLSDYQLRLLAISDWQLRGKIVVRSRGESDKAKFMWRNSEDAYKIRLSGALGMGTTYIKGDKKSVRLEQNGKAPVEASSPEQLVLDQLGRDIPISHLHFWVRGLPTTEIKIDHIRYDDNGMIKQLIQAGWILNYESFSVNGEWNLPSKMTAIREDIELELSVSKWTIDSNNLALQSHNISFFQ
ncbi:MAG: lipoprotein insertase outer membrane protein LolB [Cellvibrionaceae bacterium]